MLLVVIYTCKRWYFFFFQAEDGIRDLYVTGVQTCALPIYQPEHGIEERARLLGIAIEEKLHGALEIGEQHCHRLPLSRLRSRRGEDLLCQVPWGVALRSGHALRGRSAEHVRALPAEAVVRRVGGAALRANGGERRGALATEARARRIVLVAPGTLHRL